ncbi:hypothetical protein CSB93_1123 [Pseudomonas paraeruginosa]|uniref:Uncharacterized protein n=1 Tax=Pseudomonas paraeruginosa TaxID=2994495 RepID=A0A2R3J4K4_9PSED|nr:hypothetical protein CSB93_1123 [Pseudomonas paraeruginosa]AWE91817.1 hypothetical protein CSC28_6439 [Pseudomonas paraeruginosa]
MRTEAFSQLSKGLYLAPSSRFLLFPRGFYTYGYNSVDG